MTIYPRPPAKCENCRTPIFRFIDGQWTCLNCPLYDAIQDRDDVRRAELLALIDATRQKGRAQ